MPNHVHGIIGIEDTSTVGATCPMKNEIVDKNSTRIYQIEESRDGLEQNVRATRPTKNEIMDSDIRWVNQTEDYRDGSPLREINQPNGPLHGSLGTFIGQFKSRATKRIWALPGIDR